MADSVVRIEGLDKLMRKVKTLEDLEAVKGGISAAALHIKGKIATYPGRKSITIEQVGGWASDRQRRWFFANLRAGTIEVPYRRGQSPGSEDLGQKWTIKTRDAGLTAVIGNNASYGPFVQDEDRQSRMHRMIGWKSTQKVAEEETEEVTELVVKAVEEALSK